MTHGTIQKRIYLKPRPEGRIISRVRSAEAMLRLKPAQMISESMGLEYAPRDGQPRKEAAGMDWNRERDRMKELLLPFVKETVKKLMKEEQEYYKSRPSLAAKHYENIFRAGHFESSMVPAVARQVCSQMEERMRWEWLRKGR